MRMRLGGLIATAALMLAANSQSAEPPTAFVFLPASAPPEIAANKEADFGGVQVVSLRPNTSVEQFLYVRNPYPGDDRNFVVEWKTNAAAAQAKVLLTGNGAWKRVTFPKAAAPAVAAPVAAPPTTPAVAATPAPAAEAPLAGVKLALDALPGDKLGFVVELRLLNEDGITPAVERAGMKQPYIFRRRIEILDPRNYLAVTGKNVKDATKADGVAFSVALKTDEWTKTPAISTVDVPLTLVHHKTKPGAKLTPRAGRYEQTLPTKANAAAGLFGGVTGDKESYEVLFGAEGLRRVFTYLPSQVGKPSENVLVPTSTTKVHLFAVGRTEVTPALTPAVKLPIRIEVDKPEPGTTLRLITRSPAGPTEAPSEETVVLGTAHDEQIWVETSGPNGGIAVASRVREWVRELDLSAFRGKVEVEAIYGADAASSTKSSMLVIVDDTAPPVEQVVFGEFPKEQVKGTPLPVRVTATDPETAIGKVAFFLGKPGEDGKLPAGAVPVSATLVTEKNSASWRAELILPPDVKKGPMPISVIVVNEAGLSTIKTQEIVLVDPPAPSGSIAGKVLYGERPQPKLEVALSDAEGKVKVVAVTNDKGEFKFSNLAPGKYVVSAVRKDSGVGSKGSSEVQVENKKEPTKTTIVLTRSQSP